MLGKKKYQEVLTADRKARKTKFVVIRDEILRLRLPANAYVILSHLLTHAENYMPSRKQLAKESGLGRTAIDRALVDLQKQNVLEIEYGSNNTPKYRLKQMRDWKPSKGSTRKASSIRNLRQGKGLFPETRTFKYATVYKRLLKKITTIVESSNVKDLVQSSLPALIAKQLVWTELSLSLDTENSKIYQGITEDWVFWIKEYLSGNSEDILLLPVVLSSPEPDVELKTWVEYLDIRLTSLKDYLLSSIDGSPAHPFTEHRKTLLRFLIEMDENYSPAELAALTEERIKPLFLRDAGLRDLEPYSSQHRKDWEVYGKVWDTCVLRYQKEFPESK